MEQQLLQMENSLQKLKNKESKMYFLVQDTGGAALASVCTIYQYVKYLREEGYEAYVLHEKTDYKGVADWLDEEYVNLPHANIESGDLKVGPQDFVIIPEIFGHVLEQLVKMPCTRIVLSQAYDYILETLNPGFGWMNYGVSQCITTSEEQANHIKTLFPSVVSTIIPISLPDYFKKSDKPKKPIIAIHTRDQRDTMKIIKTFYLQNPHFKWVTFRDMRGLSRKEFASVLGESCLSVWIDKISSFGTFPLESMKCGSPVIGVLPVMKPSWITKENGLWTFDESKIVETIGNFMKNWLEDTVPPMLYEHMEKTVTSTNLSEETEKNNLLRYFDVLISNKITEIEMAVGQAKPVEQTI